MSVFHCPICPLIFEYRTEVEWHLRNEHRSRSDEQADLTAEISAAMRAELDWPLLRSLQASRSGTAVTLLMRTTPAPAMTRVDVARLRRLAFQARHRIAGEPGGAPPALDERFARVVAAAEGEPTQEGLALLADAEHLALFHLPLAPVDRVVVDPTFATRDLETALRRFPRYRAILLGTTPRVFEGRGMRLTGVEGCAGAGAGVGEPVPIHRDGKRAVRPERWVHGRASREAGVRRADELLSDRLRETGDLPLIVAGDGRWRDQFRRQSRHRARVVAEVSAVHGKDTASRLAALAQPHLERLQKDEQEAVIGELLRAEAVGSVAWGLQPAWTAVQDGTADLVWVDQGYACPGKAVGEGREVELTAAPEEPGAIDDLVDDLVEAATARAIGVHLVAAGSLPGPQPIAARMRADVPAVPVDTPLAEAV